MIIPVPACRRVMQHEGQHYGSAINFALLLFHLAIAAGVVGVCALKLSALFYQFGVGRSMWLGEFQSKYIWIFQLVLGLAFGWGSSRLYHHSVANWVWVLPAIYLGLRIFFWHDPASSVLSPHRFSSVFDHFFGSGCSFSSSIEELRYRGGPVCMDQLLVTGPFYGALAYALGTVAERKGLIHLIRHRIDGLGTSLHEDDSLS
ncbi:MAG TPA: hypothetical protein VFA76_12785 [Terriglobales bacterium]|nr:hypothetical protein [Terriglobales bacterium]